MKKNVLHLIPSFHQGGSERQAIQLTKLLVDEGSYNVSLACLDKSGVLLEHAIKLAIEDIPDFPLTSFYDANTVRQIRRFVGYLRTEKIDIVQTHDFYTNIFGMLGAKLAGVPVRIAAKRETGMRTPKQRFIERRAFGLANVVVVNSERVRKYLMEAGVSAAKLEVVYNGIDHKKFDGGSFDRLKLLSEFGVPTDCSFRFVTIVANLRSRVKNHEMFLRSAADIAERVNDAGFIIAGEGELLDEKKAVADKLGLSDRTFFIGRCTRIPELLAISDVCVLTSESEGFSNSLLEYMAAGKPVVATDVGGAAEAVVEGKTGFLIAENDHRSFADKICALLTNHDLAQRMGQEGKRRVAEQFSLETQLERTLGIYAGEPEKTGNGIPKSQ